MTALPLRDFTAAEQAKLAAIEAAPAAAESVRERVARAMCDAGAEDGRWSWSEMHESIRDGYRQLADAAIATMRGPGSYVEQAVERHDGIVREATDLCWKATPYGSTEDGAVAGYILPAGVVHRLLGQLQGAGYSAAFRAIAGPSC
jgi:hypothetical protein